MFTNRRELQILQQGVGLVDRWRHSTIRSSRFPLIARTLMA
jgi:hypothetical protein